MVRAKKRSAVTSPKRIDREGLGGSRAGTRQTLQYNKGWTCYIRMLHCLAGALRVLASSRVLIGSLSYAWLSVIIGQSNYCGFGLSDTQLKRSNALL